MLTSEFWDKYFKVYDVLNLVIPYRELLEKIADEADIQKGDLVLEAGIGTGNLAELLEKKGAKVIGLDFSKEALEICKKKKIGTEFVLADLSQRLPFPDNYFDKIVSNNTLYAIPIEKQSAVLREFHRVLKPNANIVLANLKEGWKPIKIYSAHIKKSLKQNGFLFTFQQIITMIIPTIKMFYYNHLIIREGGNNFHFYRFNEQRELLKEAGFNNISKTVLVFVNQAILNTAQKHRNNQQVKAKN